MKNPQSETKVTFKKEMINFYGKPAIIRLLLSAYLHTTTIPIAINYFNVIAHLQMYTIQHLQYYWRKLHGTFIPIFWSCQFCY